MEIRPGNISDSESISRLLTNLSGKYIVSIFNDEGRESMLNSMTPEAIEGFFNQGFRYHVGEVESEIVAVVGMRDDCYLLHLFVDDRYQNKGFSSKLWSVGAAACLESGKNPGYFTVNSSLNAQAVYKNWGFTPIGGVREGGGVRDLPMKLELAS